MINIKGMDKAEVLAKLYNHARPLGLGFLAYTPKQMSKEEAAKLLEMYENQEEIYFNYLEGRVMKVDLMGDEFDEFLYDRYNGTGAAKSALGLV